MSVMALAVLGGCVSPPEDAEARLAALEAEEARMDAAFDVVETRLLGNQARVHLWEEMERRHGEVSAIQCRVTDRHLRGIATHLARQQEKTREQSRRRHMASAGTVLTSATR
ncbi:hypothetical protein [Melittangium boletus]|uniref:Lipoprotein n=1 Tax=Melittangium boletus DSM 14713 TaxID=1294270 RepID=A0A250IGR9_9BACT|nr:hypothetical protein [Melittangium boletus]ATB30357.1 lipoprotein [Melittangium boletus DSM 14713]